MTELTAQQNMMFSKKALYQLILPLVVEQLLAVAIGMADTVMVASVGEAAVSGISLVDSINMLLIQILAALATGGAVVTSMYLGREQAHNACTAAKQLMYSTTVLGLLLMLIALIFNRGILQMIYGNIDPDVMKNAETYFWLSALSYPFLAIYNSGAALFRSMGNSKVSMFTSILMNVINIGGNAILIFIFNWGVAGAGTASLFSRMVAAGIILVLVCQPKHEIHITKLQRPEWNWKMIKNILKIGIPTGLENGMFHIGKLLVQGLVATFGTAAIAANAISNSVASIANIPGAAVGLAMVTVVGQCVGAKKYDQAVSYTKRLMLVTYLAMGALNIGIFVFVSPLVHVFNLSSEATETAKMILRYCAVCCTFIWPIAFTLPNALRAAGDAKYTMIISVISMWIFRIGCSYLFALTFHMGLFGVWVAMFVDWLVRAAIFMVRFARGKWKNIHVIES